MVQTTNGVLLRGMIMDAASERSEQDRFLGKRSGRRNAVSPSTVRPMHSRLRTFQFRGFIARIFSPLDSLVET